ncbi:DNA polymerase subunit Cdc27-domain-containing protein [Crepidotus variabilis]|uniref:DNA polymerase delta subunit 3 n=1 Tax=Crepidotus variabilis TaxID=179855 RepID=A0A9P6JM26_9AGAR|nr:DNA polymerase subunit Cdc27-domain-containing protein [Crepidotus variabilis]
MSTQSITDYLTKQIFIERNIVTFRSLSRHFSIHVNAAKNELATFHHNAQYQSQQSSAMFVLSGVSTRRGSAWSQSQNYTLPQPRTQDEDVDMDATQTEATQMSVPNGHAAIDTEDEEADTEEAEKAVIMLVNEKDLEGSKAKFLDIHSIYVYSLAPAPLIDAALICDLTEQVRAIDRSKGVEWSLKIGRLVGADIKVGASKKGKPPVAAPPAAGPSRVKPSGPSAPVISGSSMTALPTKLVASKTESKLKTEPSVSGFYSDKGKEKEKPKGNGKLNFFAKPKDTTSTANVTEKNEKSKDKAEEKEREKEEPQMKIKKADSTVDMNKKMFFSSGKAVSGSKDVKAVPPAQAKASPSTEKQEAPPYRIGPPRGIKRKPSAALDSNSRERTPDNPAAAKEKNADKVTMKTSDKQKEAAGSGTRRRGNKILSDDEDEEMELKPKKSRRARSRASLTSDSDRNGAIDPEAERQGRALMEMDDDLVERVSHAPSTVVSASDGSLEEGGGTASEMEENTSMRDVKAEDSDGDIDMDDEVAAKPKPKKRKPKVVVPVGRNGLKKRKVTKTRSVKGAKGYIIKEDYSEWESVEEGEEEPEPEPKPPKVVKEKKKTEVTMAPTVKKEQEDDTETSIDNAKEEPEKEKDLKEKKPSDKKKIEKDKPSKPMKKPAGNVKTQKGMMMNFFKKP